MVFCYRLRYQGYSAVWLFAISLARNFIYLALLMRPFHLLDKSLYPLELQPIPLQLQGVRG